MGCVPFVSAILQSCVKVSTKVIQIICYMQIITVAEQRLQINDFVINPYFAYKYWSSHIVC